MRRPVLALLGTALALDAASHLGGLFAAPQTRPSPSSSSYGDITAEVQAILKELSLDDDPRSTDPIVQAPSASGQAPGLVSLQEQWQAEERRKQELLERQRQHQLELDQLRRKQQELHRAEEGWPRPSRAEPSEAWSETPPLPPGPRPSQVPVHQAESKVEALRRLGIREAPEYGSDSFVASLQQIKMLVRSQVAQHAQDRTRNLQVQALQRYVEQLEMDLDSKEEELSATKEELAEERQQTQRQMQRVSDANSDSEAMSEAVSKAADAGAKAHALEEQLAAAAQAQEELQSQLEQQAQRAENAEHKLLTVINSIRARQAKKQR